VIASALYELSRYSRNGVEYLTTADKILASLTNKYRSPVGDNKGFILLHSTGSRVSNSEVDVPLNYADYYYLEALLRSGSDKDATIAFSLLSMRKTCVKKILYLPVSRYASPPAKDQRWNTAAFWGNGN